MNTKEVIECMGRYAMGDILIKENIADINLECAHTPGKYVNMKRAPNDSNVVTLCKAIKMYINVERGIAACVAETNDINQSDRG